MSQVLVGSNCSLIDEEEEEREDDEGNKARVDSHSPMVLALWPWH